MAICYNLDMVNILLFVFLLCGIVTIHEFGHFIFAKLFGVYCHEFSIGMGPLVYSHKFKETTLSLRALPIGGFVAMAGDNDNQLETKVDVEVPFERTLPGIHPLKRIIVMLAGILMNFILALVIIAVIFLSYGYTSVVDNTVISEVNAGLPAQKAGLRAGDEIKEIVFENGYSFKPSSFSEISSFMAAYEGGEITVYVNRDNEELSFSLLPQYDQAEDRYLIGIVSGEYQIEEVNLLNCWSYSASYLWMMMRLTFMTLAGLLRGVGLDNVSGPVGIYNVTSQAVSYGATSYFSLVALLSLNVGIFNALPLPVMDGGRVLITIIEVITGHSINKKFENIIMTASVIILLGLMIIVTFKDVIKLF